MKLKEIFKPEKKYIIIYVGFAISLFIYLLIYIAGELNRNGIIQQNLVPDVYLSQFVVILPGPLITDVILLYILPIVIFIVFYKIAPITIKVYLKIHKLSYIGRSKPQYGMVELGNHRNVSALIRRAILVGFLSFSITALIVQGGFPLLFRALESFMTPDMVMSNYLFLSEAVFLGTFLLTSLALFIFLPIWL